MATTETNTLHSVRLATARDASALPAIENSAGDAFRALPGYEWVADGGDLPAERYAELITFGTTWVAADGDDAPIAFLAASIEDNCLHIWELGVSRAHQRSGLGRTLLDHAISAAKQRGLRAVTLTTFREAPWNAPFYARLGFAIVAPKQDARLDALLLDERARGLPAHLRCAMRLSL